MFGDRNNSAPISGNDRWVARSGRTRSSAAVSDEAPWAPGRALLWTAGPERLGLADQGAQAGPALEHVIDLAHLGPGRGEVAEGQPDTGELDPGLNGQVGLRVGKQRTHALSRDKRLLRRRGIAPVPGHPG